MTFFVILLLCFICVERIKINKMNLISQKYQIMIVCILKNYNQRYFNHYIIKFIVFILIYYVININIVSLFIY